MLYLGVMTSGALVNTKGVGVALSVKIPTLSADVNLVVSTQVVLICEMWRVSTEPQC